MAVILRHTCAKHSCPENAAFANELWPLGSDRSWLCRRFCFRPVLKWTLAALGGAIIVHWAVKEARRINEELENARRVKAKITRC